MKNYSEEEKRDCQKNGNRATLMVIFAMLVTIIVLLAIVAANYGGTSAVDEKTQDAERLEGENTALSERLDELENKLKETEETYCVYYSDNNETIYQEIVKKGDDVQNVPEAPIWNGMQGEWNANGKNVQADMVIYAEYESTLTFKSAEEGGEAVMEFSTDSVKVKCKRGTKLVFGEYSISLDGTVLVTATLKDGFEEYVVDGWTDEAVESVEYEEYRSYNEGDEYLLTGDAEFTLMASYACIAEGSKIAMGDGTLKNVEYVRPGDMVLSYDYFSGKIEPKKVVAILAGRSEARVLTVRLSSGESLEIVDSECVFDMDAREFVPINIRTYKDNIGKRIMMNIGGEIGETEILDITLGVREVNHYTMYTEGSLNYIACGIVAKTPICVMNIIKIGEDYKVDEAALNADIEQYGVFTYEEVADCCTEEVFNELPIKYGKIAVGKGTMTMEQMKVAIKLWQQEIDNANAFYDK